MRDFCLGHEREHARAKCEDFIKHEIGHALTKLGDEAENGVGWVRKIADQPNGSVMDYSDFLKYGVFGHMLPYSPSMLTIIRTNFGLPAGGVLPASPYR